jgi:hypothetical protein
MVSFDDCGPLMLGFLRTWLTVCIASAAVVCAFDAVMDPYLVVGVPRIAGFNSVKPAVDLQQHLMKAYDVIRAKPSTLILGSSRVDLGLDARDSEWPAQVRPVYNLGFAGGGPYVSYRYLQHVISQRHIVLVVLGLDFEYFLGDQEADKAEQRELDSHLATAPDGAFKAHRISQHVWDIFQATLSLDALIDSVATLASNLAGDSSDLVAGNWNWGNYRHVSDRAGSYPLVVGMDLVTIRSFYKRQRRDPRAMENVRAILDLCESQETQVILVINPVHADDLELLGQLGYWQAFEDWKRELVALTSKYRAVNGRTPIALWDFTGYNAYSTETVSADGRRLRWFWDSLHYTHSLGKLVVQRIFGAGDVAFGVILDEGTIERHHAAIREQQKLYRSRQPADTQRVHELYKWVIETGKIN